MDHHFLSLKTVEEYANLLHISPGHLNKICKQHMNKNASSIIKARIKLETKRLILYSENGITEIAYEHNYADLSNFSSFFSPYSKNRLENFGED